MCAAIWACSGCIHTQARISQTRRNMARNQKGRPAAKLTARITSISGSADWKADYSTEKTAAKSAPAGGFQDYFFHWTRRLRLEVG
jgi:hypothetical protein